MTEQEVKSYLASIVVILFILVFALILVLAGTPRLGDSSLFIKRPPRTDMVPVVVTAQDIQRGQAITADRLKIREYPKEFVPLGAITRREEASGRTAAVPLAKDDVVLDNELTPKGAGRGLPP